MLLLVITLLNGLEVQLNPHEIVAILEARRGDDPLKRYAEGVRCVIQMSNNQHYAIAETCASVRERLQELRR